MTSSAHFTINLSDEPGSMHPIQIDVTTIHIDGADWTLSDGVTTHRFDLTPPDALYIAASLTVAANIATFGAWSGYQLDDGDDE